ncbi:MAG: serine hydrolase domain-containing protein [SAR202 cluster bacterium]|jgi:CubicO group peptidase (beta-lactamase class C family)|nr:serine hydrolase domain-containing protein [SAR202 cluster bacterium]
MTHESMSYEAVASNIDLLSAWIESQMAYSGQPGLSIAIIFDQKLVWSKGFGHSDIASGAPAKPDTIYRIASITKLFTATSIMQLRDGGKLQLDDPITKHLPWFDIQNKHLDAPAITIRHLITHTSGLPREAAFPYWTDSEFPTRDQMVDALSKQETVLPTETRWKYSNLALSLAGEIVATVSGIGYAEYVQRNILDPLDMASTFVNSPDRDNPSLATGYGRRQPDGNRHVSPFTDGKGITAAANMSTTVEDLAKFAMLQFRDGNAGGIQILKGSSLREMHRVHWLDQDWISGWGLGFNVRRIGGKTHVGHGGAVQGFRTHVRLIPAHKIGVIAFTNADDGNPEMYIDKAFQWVAPAILNASDSDSRFAYSRPEWQAYFGKYQSAWSDLQVLQLNGKLVAIDPSQPDPMESMSTLSPLGEHTFRIENPLGGSAHGEKFVFELNDQGRVERLWVGENYSFPVQDW